MRTWPAALSRVPVSKSLLGELLLAVLLAVTVTTSWRDGMPTDQLADLVAPPVTTIDSSQVLGTGSKLPLVQPAPAPLPYMPSASPVQLLISRLDVHRAVEKVGVDEFGTMQLPVNAWNAGWYRWGPVPGAPGDAVIEGHAGYPNQPMIFLSYVCLLGDDSTIGYWLVATPSLSYSPR